MLRSIKTRSPPQNPGRLVESSKEGRVVIARFIYQESFQLVWQCIATLAAPRLTSSTHRITEMYLPDTQSIIAASLVLTGTLTKRVSPPRSRPMYSANRMSSGDGGLGQDPRLRGGEVH